MTTGIPQDALDCRCIRAGVGCVHTNPYIAFMKTPVVIAGILFADAVVHKPTGDTTRCGANDGTGGGGAADKTKRLGYCAQREKRADARNRKRREPRDSSDTCANTCAFGGTARLIVGVTRIMPRTAMFIAVLVKH
ncbi:MAG: hypothetical protein AB7L36_05505 [Sphingomonadaceae bacterium]